jgi:low affinity Fe/Cu permease
LARTPGYALDYRRIRDRSHWPIGDGFHSWLALRLASGSTGCSNGDFMSDSEHWFSRVATKTANNSGRPWAFGVAGLFVVGWLVTGPIFHFSDTWQLVMNTISSIVTFLMVFLIQNSQNRDGAAVQLKLDELIRVTQARNDLIGIERLSEPEIASVKDDVQGPGGSSKSPMGKDQ